MTKLEQDTFGGDGYRKWIKCPTCGNKVTIEDYYNPDPDYIQEFIDDTKATCQKVGGFLIKTAKVVKEGILKVFKNEK